MRRKDKVNENKVISLRYMWNKIEDIEKVFLHYVKLTNPLSFQTRFQKVEQHTRGKWLIHGTVLKDNQFQSLELPCRMSW